MLFSLSTGQVLEVFFFRDKIGQQSAWFWNFYVFPPSFLLLTSSSSFLFDEEYEKRCIALGALKQAKWNKKKEKI